MILINSPLATIMTEPDLGDATNLEPVTPEWAEHVIEKEKPNAIRLVLDGRHDARRCVGCGGVRRPAEEPTRADAREDGTG